MSYEEVSGDIFTQFFYALSQLIHLNEAGVQTVAMVIKMLFVIVLCLQVPPIMVWLERRGPALMQRRRGPNRVGIFKVRLWGLLQSFADAVKLIFKEEVVTDKANKGFYHVAPIFGVVPAFLIAAAIPFGPPMEIAGHTISLSIVSLDVGFLFIFAISSLAVYAVTIAGWACNNKYALLGSLRASAQMISYEIPLGLSLIPIVLIYQTLDLQAIAMAQDHFFRWGVFLSPLSFLIFLICMFAETNRAPFDLAEGESELIAGFHTEFNSAKFALFFLSEYVSMFVLSCLASVLFFGGWQIPFVPFTAVYDLLGPILAPLVGMLVLLLKAAFFMWVYVWVRWTLPRFRYDQLMSLGWKFMLPVGLANIIITAGFLALTQFN